MKPYHCLPVLLMFTWTSTFAGPVKTENEAIKLATDAIHRFHLTTLQDECGLIDVVEKPAYFELVVHERHTPNCGGTSDTGPRLFNLHVRKRDGQVSSDVYDGIGYRPADREPEKLPAASVRHD